MQDETTVKVLLWILLFQLNLHWIWFSLIHGESDLWWFPMKDHQGAICSTWATAREFRHQLWNISLLLICLLKWVDLVQCHFCVQTLFGYGFPTASIIIEFGTFWILTVPAIGPPLILRCLNIGPVPEGSWTLFPLDIRADHRVASKCLNAFFGFHIGAEWVGLSERWFVWNSFVGIWILSYYAHHCWFFLRRYQFQLTLNLLRGWVIINTLPNLLHEPYLFLLKLLCPMEQLPSILFWLGHLKSSSQLFRNCEDFFIDVYQDRLYLDAKATLLALVERGGAGHFLLEGCKDADLWRVLLFYLVEEINSLKIFRHFKNYWLKKLK